jgi:hypothetical protein
LSGREVLCFVERVEARMGVDGQIRRCRKRSSCIRIAQALGAVLQSAARLSPRSCAIVNFSAATWAKALTR